MNPSAGFYNSIIQNIYNASQYQAFQASGNITASTTDSSLNYSGMSLSFTPLHSENALIVYDIYSGLNGGLATVNGSLFIDTNPPPPVGSLVVGTATQLDTALIVVNQHWTQTLFIMDGIIYGGSLGGFPYSLSTNIEYYLTWYLATITSGTSATLTVYGTAVKSV